LAKCSPCSFYIYRDDVDPNKEPILLVPTRQLEYFLATINKKLGTKLTIPTGGSNSAFEVTFASDGTPRPRYLGRSTNRDMADTLKNNVPPSYWKLDSEPKAMGYPSNASLTAFRAKMALLAQAQKGKKVANKEKQKKDRIEKQQSWNKSIKRVQRYLGFREVRKDVRAEIKASLEGPELEWGYYDAAVKAAAADLPSSVFFHPDKPAQFDQEDAVIFICVDIEAYEKNIKQITEIGIATLDTLDIKSLAPGKEGVNWRSKIRARHFRIEEHKHFHNSQFVSGCADRFQFG